MNQRATGGDDDLRTYDDFRTPAINPDKWVTAKLPLGGGKVWEYFDPNTAIRTGDGRCEITVNPFSRSHDSIQIADNPKTLFACREPLDLAGAQVLTLSADVGAESHGTNVHDIWDGFVTLNLFDFESGIVLDFLLNGRRVYALYERLFMPGLTDEDTAFTREANLTVHSRPRQMHRCAFVYDRSRDTAEWRLDGEPGLPRGEDSRQGQQVFPRDGADDPEADRGAVALLFPEVNLQPRPGHHGNMVEHPVADSLSTR